MYYSTYKGKKKKTSNDKNINNNYKKIPYISVNLVSLLFWIAISLCILTFSIKSDRKLSKHSFSSCKHLQYMEYFAIRSV